MQPAQSRVSRGPREQWDRHVALDRMFEIIRNSPRQLTPEYEALLYEWLEMPRSEWNLDDPALFEEYDCAWWLLYAYFFKGFEPKAIEFLERSADSRASHALALLAWVLDGPPPSGRLQGWYVSVSGTYPWTWDERFARARERLAKARAAKSAV